MSFTLEPDDIHVWDATLDSAGSLDELSPDEQARASRFRFAVDRDRYVAARGILRKLAGRYLGLAATDVTITTSPKGKPALGAGDRSLRFSVSHARDRALYAFARGREVGIDIERILDDADLPALAARICSPLEAAALRKLEGGDRTTALFVVWTRKEAYLKACGTGLRDDLTAIEVWRGIDAPAQVVDRGQETVYSATGLSAPAGYISALSVAGSPLGGVRVTRKTFTSDLSL